MKSVRSIPLRFLLLSSIFRQKKENVLFGKLIVIDLRGFGLTEFPLGEKAIEDNDQVKKY